ncbi:hypothetical protein HS1genome_2222 [Sulfodiicoccus acidiphilus]|uniref:Uncharacterized protein n=1 Tax=Sulfodiicoccus acidiphilus TaxID=1670455 RepID=A0A348B6N1_9CREN|nr:long-chain fatty acid--CoA ligase [Sulfodiicoccus acidiphilus]BBD73833.1 hypothetical protein HS1genome_2222 [Sulfodiicoccus acidiphilus]GGT96425.1 hypothetical protein GCM10007116_12520 [Sulfodiicoccus acidiphilus]
MVVYLWSWALSYYATMTGSDYVLVGKFDPRKHALLSRKYNVSWRAMVPTML